MCNKDPQPAAPQPGDLIQIRIDSLAYQGNGVGRYQGMVCFVPFTAPGDEVSVRVTRTHRSYLEADVVGIVTPSPERVEPECPHFGVCGGCQWQHVEYQTQLEAKRLLVAEQLSRIGHLETMVMPTVPSALVYGYRNRVRLHVDAQRGLGYFQRGSHQVTPIDSCPLLDDRLNQALEGAVQRAAESDRGEGTPPPRSGRRPRHRDHREISLVIDPGDQVIVTGSDSRSTVFGQVNSLVNQRLQEEVVRIAQIHLPEDGVVLDLYCGDGNLSLPLADRAGTITGFDLSSAAVRRAAERADHPHAHYRRGPVNTALLSRLKGRPIDLLILDPPRHGLKGLASAVAGLRAKTIAYVSCVPPVLARDLQSLVSAGYNLDFVQPFDMFPQTFHVEVLAVLRLKDPLPK